MRTIPTFLMMMTLDEIITKPSIITNDCIFKYFRIQLKTLGVFGSMMKTILTFLMMMMRLDEIITKPSSVD